jgi:RimJ/RimL family protein N-acetyltransferase
MPSSLMTGRQVRLRPLGFGHLDILRGWRSEPGFSSPCLNWPPTDDQLDALLRHNEVNRGFLIESNLQEHLGWCAYQRLDWKNRHANLIWGSRRIAAGREREALELLVFFAFSELGLERVETETVASETESARMVEGLGFKPEALRREAAQRAGKPVDLRVHGLLRIEWEMAFA